MRFLLVALLWLSGLQDPVPAGTAAVEGVVTRAGSSQPIENAHIVLFGDRGPRFEARTDGNGHFIVSNMPAGIFNIQVQADGYRGYPPSDLMVVRIGLSAGQRLRRDVALSVSSSISGLILDDNREPMTGISVELVQQSPDFTGRITWQRVGSAFTDDKGVYRFSDLPPGDFYVRASRKPLQAVPNREFTRSTTTFFPGTLDPRAAASISLRAGDIKTADFSLLNDKTFAIAGTIKNEDGSPLQSVRLFVLPQDPTTPLDELSQGISVNEKFELKGLLPGVYDLFAVSSSPSRRTSAGVFTETGPSRAVKSFVEIRDEDVRDLQLSLEIGGDVSGRIRFVGKNVELPRLRLMLTRRDGLNSGIPRPGVLESPESFKFSGAVPGVYDLSVVIPGSNAYVTDVRAFGRSIVDEGLTIDHGAVDSLEVWIDVDGGTVSGRIASTKKSPVVVVLAPNPSQGKFRLLLKAEGLEDPSKPFSFSGVPPGLYSLFAFELASIDEVLPILSPDFLPLYQSKSISINVEKGATVTPPPLNLISR
jgi:hypothetical protein